MKTSCSITSSLVPNPTTKTICWCFKSGISSSPKIQPPLCTRCSSNFTNKSLKSKIRTKKRWNEGKYSKIQNTATRVDQMFTQNCCNCFDIDKSLQVQFKIGPRQGRNVSNLYVTVRNIYFSDSFVFQTSNLYDTQRTWPFSKYPTVGRSGLWISTSQLIISTIEENLDCVGE